MGNRQVQHPDCALSFVLLSECNKNKVLLYSFKIYSIHLNVIDAGF